ncbi:hypothetical protein [Paenibacillus elgii]|uniref:hypothetical protein n=1 Tax=Paenibacillus elgii TaxID=189691 RepID=UPI000248D40E|nr:hypothetical protein [Paenibacillus elgii]
MDGFPVISLPDGYDLLEVFIGTELQANNEDGKWIIEAINAVIDGEVEHIWLQAKYLTLNLKNQRTRKLVVNKSMKRRFQFEIMGEPYAKHI